MSASKPASSNLGGVVKLRVANARNKLVAAIASRKSVVADNRLNCLCNVLENLVACRVGVVIVVVLEVVYVDKQNRHLALSSLRKSNLIVNLALDCFAVIELSERVVACARGELLLGLLCAVDINHNADNLQRLVILIVEGSRSHKHPDKVAVDVLHTVLVALERLSLFELVEVLSVTVRVVGVELCFKQEAVAEVVGRSAVGELLVEVV